MTKVAAKKVAAKVAEPVAVIATPAEEIVDVVTPAVEAPEYEFDVAEPFIMKPQDLPLVVKPGAGKEWVNAEQAEYAKTLNGYAYKNPAKWQLKKVKLLKNLTRLSTDPGYINFLRGAEPENVKLTYSNKLMQS
jgi:hypothetical protein